MMSKMTVEYKAKLKCDLQFLKQIISNKLVIGTYNLIQLCTWVDAAYGMHPGLKRHTDSGMLFGYRIIHCKYSKKIKTFY